MRGQDCLINTANRVLCHCLLGSEFVVMNETDPLPDVMEAVVKGSRHIFKEIHMPAFNYTL